MTMTREEALTIVTSIVREHSRECREPKPCQDCELEAEAIAALSAQADTKQAEPLRVTDWRPMKIAPTNGERVLLAIDGVNRAILASHNGSEWETIDGHDWRGRKILSWHPMPELPALHQLGAKVEVSDG